MSKNPGVAVAEIALPMKKRRGRPPGQKMRTAIENLRLHHFSFLRMCLEGLSVRQAWERYLAFEGGPDDARHFEARRRELESLVRAAADSRGMSSDAALAFGADEAPTDGEADRPPLPSLDDWIQLQCEEQGIDSDFYSYGEWLNQYKEAFAVDGSPTKVSATSPTVAKSISGRVAALNKLAAALASPPALANSLTSWLSPDLARQLLRAEVDGRPLPIVTIGNLIAFCNLYHHRWWTRVPRLGEVRAKRLVAWLQPLAEALGHPLKDAVMRPFQEIQLSRQRQLSVVDEGQVFAIVPLERLAVPPELDGRIGTFRSPGPNTLGANDDLAAILKWLNEHRDSPRTFETYRGISERFYLWTVHVKRKPMSSLVAEDFKEYRAFLAAPPTEWIQHRRVTRDSSDWRPFRGPLAPSVQALNLTVVKGMLQSLMTAGYLTANAASIVVGKMKLPKLSIDASRTFDQGQWAFVMKCWEELYEEAGPNANGGNPILAPSPALPDSKPALARRLRRTRLLLELGSTTGLRLIEFASTRRASLRQVTVDGDEVWMLRVHGKGSKDREVLIFDDVKALIDQHHKDMVAAGVTPGPMNKVVIAADGGSARFRRTLLRRRPSDPVSPSDPSPPLSGADEEMAPIVGALQLPPPRWQLDKNGVRTLNRADRATTDAWGAIDPTALYQSLKRFFAHCAMRARELGEGDAAFRLASTHWLRHFFATAAASDGVDVIVLQKAMGHASVATTSSTYIHPERTSMVRELKRLKRR